MKNNRFLLSSLVTVMVVIGLVEFGIIQIQNAPLYADQEETSLILKKGEETVEIKPNDKIIINEQVMAYRSVDKVNKLILASGQNVERTIRFDEILTIHIPAGSKAKEYGKKGMKIGGLIGLAYAGFVGVFALSTEPRQAYIALVLAPICSGIDAGVLGLSGLAIGYAKKTGGETYQLGPSEWEIANE